MILIGTLCTIGDLAECDAQPMVGVPAIQIRTDDGRIITVTGLTREEVLTAAPMFLDLVRMNLTLDVA